MQEIPLNCNTLRAVTAPWYKHQALQRQLTLQSGRWSCHKISLHNFRSWAVLILESRGPHWPSQTIKNSSLLLRFFHLICFNKTILSQWVPGNSRTNISLFSQSSHFNHRHYSNSTVKTKRNWFPVAHEDDCALPTSCKTEPHIFLTKRCCLSAAARIA